MKCRDARFDCSWSCEVSHSWGAYHTASWMFLKAAVKHVSSGESHLTEKDVSVTTRGLMVVGASFQSCLQKGKA